jgi:ribosomal protein S18
MDLKRSFTDTDIKGDITDKDAKKPRLDNLEFNDNVYNISPAENFLKPILVTSITNSDKLVIDFESDPEMLNNFVSSVAKCIMDHESDNLVYKSFIFIFYTANNFVNRYEINNNIKNYIVIAVCLGYLLENNNIYDIDQFILGTKSEKIIIKKMIHNIFNDNFTPEPYEMYIAKYISIVDKIGDYGMYSFMKYINNFKMSNEKIYNELKKYCEIILNYSKDKNQITDYHNGRLVQTNYISNYINSNINITLNDIFIFLD